MTTQSKKGSKVETNEVEQAEHGVYIDFEGTTTDPASFLGALYWGESGLIFEQLVFEEGLDPAAEAKSPENGGFCRTSNLDDAAAWICELADAGRRVFAFSEREANVFREETKNEELGNRAADLIVNVRPIAKAWKLAHFPEVVFEKEPGFPMSGKYSLRNFLELIGVTYPNNLGKHKTSGNINRVREQLRKNDGMYNDIPGGAKKAWSRALKKNQLDCEYLRDLTIRIAADGID